MIYKATSNWNRWIHHKLIENMLGIAKALSILTLGTQAVFGASGYTHNARQSRALGRRWESTNPYVTVSGSVCTVKVSRLALISPWTCAL